MKAGKCRNQLFYYHKSDGDTFNWYGTEEDLDKCVEEVNKVPEIEENWVLVQSIIEKYNIKKQKDT